MIGVTLGATPPRRRGWSGAIALATAVGVSLLAAAAAAAPNQILFSTAALFEPNSAMLSDEVRAEVLADLTRWSTRSCLDTITLEAGAPSAGDDRDQAAALAPRRLALVKAMIEQGPLPKPFQVVVNPLGETGPPSNTRGGDRIFVAVSTPRERLPDGSCR